MHLNVTSLYLCCGYSCGRMGKSNFCFSSVKNPTERNPVECFYAFCWLNTRDCQLIDLPLFLNTDHSYSAVEIINKKKWYVPSFSFANNILFNGCVRCSYNKMKYWERDIEKCTSPHESYLFWMVTHINLSAAQAMNKDKGKVLFYLLDVGVTQLNSLASWLERKKPINMTQYKFRWKKRSNTRGV